MLFLILLLVILVFFLSRKSKGPFGKKLFRGLCVALFMIPFFIFMLKYLMPEFS